MSTPPTEEDDKVDADSMAKKSLALAQVRPSRLSMEGYIYNANMVLEAALAPTSPEVTVE